MTDDQISVEALLDRAARLNLKDVIVIGEDPNGGGYLASTVRDPDDVLALLVNAIVMLSITCFAEDAQSLH